MLVRELVYAQKFVELNFVNPYGLGSLDYNKELRISGINLSKDYKILTC